MTRSLAALLLLLPLGAAEVRVDHACPWEDKDGYTPVIVRVEALTGPAEVGLEVRMGRARASDRVRVEPGRPVLRTLLVPSSSGWGQPQLSWSAPGGGGSIACPPTIEHRGLLLAVLDPLEEVPLPALTKLVEEQVKEIRSGRGGYRSRSERLRRYAAADLPDRWQGWPCWLTLLTTPAGEAALGQRQREAIAAWCLAGGRVFTTDRGAAAAWQALGVTATVVDRTAERQPELIDRLALAAAEDGRPDEHPVPGTDEVPTAWFVSLAVAFTVLVGPVNIWWVMRRRRQPWLLLLTTPAISAATCLLLIVVALLADGLGRSRTAVQVALLDQGRQRAAVFSGCTWFCGIAPGSFPLDAEERLLPFDEADWSGGWREERPPAGLDWSAGQTALGGWIPARANRQLASTRVVPERRRLMLTRNGDGWRAGNGLGTAITGLRLRDRSGVLWLADGIPPGGEAVLRRAGPTALPGTHGGIAGLRRLGPDARLALADAIDGDGWWLARLAAPLHPLPGPEAEDLEPLEAWAVGSVPEAP